MIGSTGTSEGVSEGISGVGVACFGVGVGGFWAGGEMAEMVALVGVLWFSGEVAEVEEAGMVFVGELAVFSV